MINTNRIVPVTAIDLLTLYGNIIKLAGTTVAAVNATDPATFSMASGSGNVIANEPVKTFDFGASVSAAVVYFIPSLDYVGFSINGTAVVTAGATVNADGRTLYTATLSGGTVTIAKVGF